MNCGAFNSSITIHPNGKVSPCCLFDTAHFKNINNLNLKDPWNDLKDGRGCSACKRPNPYKHYFDEYLKLEHFELQHLDVRNNNLCNFECIICCDLYSSKWAERWGRTNKFEKTNFSFPLDRINKIYFAGGEPLLNPTHWEILDQIKNPEEIILLYSTNLSVLEYKSKSVLDYWPRFKEVHVNVSLDAVGELGQELRFGLNLDKLTQNLKAIQPIADVCIVTTVSLLNIWFLSEIEQYAKDNHVRLEEYVALYTPEFLSISALPQEFKNKISNNINLQINALLKEDKSHLFLKALSFILLQDKLKNTNVFDKMPFKDYAIQRLLK